MVRCGVGGVGGGGYVGAGSVWDAGVAGVAGGSGRNSCTRARLRQCPSFIIYTPTHGKTVRT